MSLTIGILLFVLGALLTFINFTLSFVTYPLYRLGGGKPEDFRQMSGFPLFGSAMLWASMIFLGDGDHPRLTWSALVISLFDTGGIHWFGLWSLWWRFRGWRDA